MSKKNPEAQQVEKGWNHIAKMLSGITSPTAIGAIDADTQNNTLQLPNMNSTLVVKGNTRKKLTYS